MEQKQLTGNEIRQMFLDFFASKGCMVEPGASLIPHNDPTLLWINAGVSALKKYFDGTEKPKSNRICNAQKSIRTNDIENVGKTARHHTFFEMLGNFSIGDYFKTEAITWAWEFLTSPEWIGFDKNKLYVTVYPDDVDAYNMWVKVGMIPSHIRKTADNFWEIGEGPGGPDTELYYDRGEKYDPEHLGEKLFFEDIENDRYIEVWNIVFSQYDCKPGQIPRTEYKELPQKNIDTGMGLERLVCLVQDGETNFDTDLFLPIIHETEKYAKYPYSNPEYKMAYRVIADHIRTVTFAIADGATFSNEGRGYVLRRVLRRAARYGIKLGIQGSFMYKLVQVVADMMNAYYPYLEGKVALISKLVKTEEESFHTTLANGENLLNQALKEHEDTKVLPGNVVFKLYDTYGFPKELTTEIAEEAGYTVDLEGFNAEMEAQKQRARDARSNEQSMGSQSKALMDFVEPSKFVGYTEKSCKGHVIGLFVDGEKVDEIHESGEIIVDETCFYAESGGQIYDTGVIYNDEMNAVVTKVKKAPHSQPLHHIEIKNGSIKLGDEVHLEYDYERREKTRANHSSLHLLQAALREIVGDHVAQAGSFNGPDYGRFDFTHYEKLTEEQLHQIENRVNEMIAANVEITTEVMDIEEAKQSGAIALFDEKYGDKVRVVTMGEFSKEFCGGTHAYRTGDLGVFKIVSEESIGSGVRRITSITKMEAYKAFKAEEDYLISCSKSLKNNNPMILQDKINQLLEENAKLKKENEQAKQKALLAEADSVISRSEKINNFNVIMMDVKDKDGASLKGYAETLRNKLEDSIVFLTSNVNDKLTLVCACSKTAIAAGIKAGDLVKKAAEITDGKGGGRPDIAQAGGKDITKLQDALNAVKEAIKNA